MLLPTIKLKKHTDKGQGLFATKFIPAGTVIWLPCVSCTYYANAQLAHISLDKLKEIDELGFCTYDKGIIVPCANACYMNHSCKANVLDFGLDFGVAIRAIKPEDEVCCDYRTWDAEKWEMLCLCKTKQCVGIIRPHVNNGKQKSMWFYKINKILKKIPVVEQPLHSHLIHTSKVYQKILSGVFPYLKNPQLSVKHIKTK